jgi:type 2 lantibiotic biosynthesis protein LanM
MTFPSPYTSGVTDSFLPVSLRQHLLREGWWLHERLPFAPAADSSTDLDGLSVWQHAIAPDMPSKLSDRLAWSGYTLEQAAWAMNPPDGAIPDQAAWLPLLEEICAETQRRSAWLFDSNHYQDLNYPLQANHPLPFEDLWLPAIAIARRHLLACGVEDTPLSQTAMADLERSLLERLCTQAVNALYEAFNHGRTAGSQLLATILKTPDSAQSATHYQDFIRRHAQTGLCDLLQIYPVLGRIISTVVEVWIEGTAELLQRLTADWSDLRVFCSGMQSPAKVLKIQTSLSDPHRRGRTTSILSLDNGEKVVYKPKDLGLDQAYQTFLDWCNQALEPERPFKSLTILQREGYGWVEFVPYWPSTTPTEWKEFYNQAGALTAVLFLLGATDCHQENLIASGQDLVLIDTETLLQSEVEVMDANLNRDNRSEIDIKFSESVNRIGMLPRWLLLEGKRIAIDMSALGSSPIPEALGKTKILQNINIDEMGWGLADPDFQRNTSLPYTQVNEVNLQDYVDDLVAGFSRTYRAFMAHRHELLSPAGPLSVFQHQRMRLLFRATRIYAVLLMQGLQSETLKDGVRFSLTLEYLTRAFLVAAERPTLWPLLAVELHDMACLDIPFFEYWSDSADLPLPDGGVVPDYFQPHGYQALLDRVTQLSDTDLEFQQAIIRGAFAARQTGSVSVESSHDIPVRLDANLKVAPADWLQEAEEIAQGIVHQSLRDLQNRPYWLGYSFVANGGQLQFSPISPGLYDGRCGIALFLAALDRVRHTHQYDDFITDLLYPLAHLIHTNSPRDRWRYVRDQSLGAAGVAGMIYTLVYLHRWQIDLQPISPLALATMLADTIDAVMIDQDQSFDFLGGSTGAILAGLTLFQETQDSRWLRLAEQCGHHLLSHQDATTGGWRAYSRPPLTGFSHGAAGMVYALLSLYAATDNLAFRDGAIAGLEYETHVFNPEQNNWPDYRYGTDNPSFKNQWCNGASGIALSRLACLSLAPSLAEQLMADLNQVMPDLLAAPVNNIDHLCCGNMGRAEILWCCGQQLIRNDCTNQALAVAKTVVERAHQQQHYSLMGLMEGDIYNPGFFQGMAGIGYQLLRFIAPERLPCALLLES